jgi:membrane protease YdiL (CAAX protease family)
LKGGRLSLSHEEIRPAVVLSGQAGEIVAQRAQPPEAPPALEIPSRTPRREIWFELSVVLLICVLRDLYTAIFYSGSSTGHDPNTLIHGQGYYIVRSLGIIALIFYMIRKSGDPLSRFGIDRPKPLDLLVGIGISIVVTIAYYSTWYTVYYLAQMGGYGGDHATSHHISSGIASGADGVVEYLFAAVGGLCNGAAEELVCRAYLITRLKDLFGSTASAVILSSFFFASYHIYQGSWSMINIFIIGLIYGLMFVSLRRVWPIVLAHGLQDFVAVTRLLSWHH